MQARPSRLERLPEQYFVALLKRVAAEEARAGAPVVNFGRGNPEVGPPGHVLDAARRAVAHERAHGYPPFRGLPELKRAVAARYRAVYGVNIDPEREVAVVPGTKTALAELCLVLASPGDAVLLPDPGYPDYRSGVAFVGASPHALPLEAPSFSPDFEAAPPAAVAFLNYPSNPCAVAAPPGVFDAAVRWADRHGGAVVHDFAYGDLVFDGRPPESFLSAPGAKDVGVELFSMSKSYGMAGWRLGFAVGNAELVGRLELLGDHLRAGIFRGVQEAGLAALSGPQQSVEERRARYEARRNRVLAALPGAISEGTFYVWLRLPDGLGWEQLLTEHRVALAPGGGFGPRGEGWARISLAVDDATFEEGLARLTRALA